jgi:hypothetical protein
MKKSKRSGLALMGVLALALSVTVGLTAGSVADAKKKKKAKGNTAVVSKALNAPIPDRSGVAPNLFGQLDTVLRIGKKWKGRVVAADSVKVTFQTTGSGPNAADDLDFYLIAPNGRKVALTGDIGDQNIGPLTLTPNSPVDLCDATAPPCPDPQANLNRPFAGTAGNNQLALFTGIGMRGNWIFRVQDTSAAGGTTSILNSVRLEVTAA